MPIFLSGDLLLLAGDESLSITQMPGWLVLISWISLALAGVSIIWISVDILRGHQQRMWIMNVVWPVTALWAGPLALWAYYMVGRQSPGEDGATAGDRENDHHMKKHSMPISTGLAATHCGSGCTLGDLVAEWFLFFVPGLTLFGMHIKFELFGHRIFAGWIIDFIVAFLFGIAFQYFTIQPMKKLPAGKALIEAVKADTLSLAAWQIGMYGWMAIVVFAIFGAEISKANPVFWFMMQLAMLCGFMTAFPVNWCLIRTGVKEKM